MSLSENVIKILEKFDRTPEEFQELIDFLRANGTGKLGIQYAKNYKKEQGKKYQKMLAFDVEVSKSHTFVSRAEAQTTGGGIVKAGSKIIKGVPYTVECMIYRDLYTGFWVGEFTYPKKFLLGDKIYSCTGIAQLFNLDLKERDEGNVKNPEKYLTFIKQYSPFEYLGIDDLFKQDLTKEDKKILKSKKMLKLPEVKRELEIAVNKILDASIVIDDIVKQITPPEI